MDLIQRTFKVCDEAMQQANLTTRDLDGVRIKIRDAEFSLPEIAAFVLREMKAVAEAALGQPVEKAVITVPAYFNDNQRQATKDAGRIAGLDVLRILNEPTAAALAYGYGRDIRQTVAIYDLGGGTFDVSVLEIEDGMFEVLSTCGDTYLGGEDFDDRLIDLLADQVSNEHGVNVRNDPFAFEKLKAAAEHAKIELSQEETAQIHIEGLIEVDDRSIDLEFELTRPHFDKLVMDLIQRTFKVCDEAMQQANLTTRDLDGVILVGGPTRLPTIRDAVTQYFSRQPDVERNPDEVVALGAAIHAATLVAPDNNDDAVLVDVTPLSLRIGISGGMTEVLIDRNSPVPIESSRLFTPARDEQESVSVRIYQGEARSSEDNTLLGEFEFSGFQPGPRDQTQIEVSFSISTEGIVLVSARDPRTGIAHSTTVSMTSGLSAEELAALISQYAAEDEAAADEPLSAPPPPTKPLGPMLRPEYEPIEAAPPVAPAPPAPSEPAPELSALPEPQAAPELTPDVDDDDDDDDTYLGADLSAELSDEDLDSELLKLAGQDQEELEVEREHLFGGSGLDLSQADSDAIELEDDGEPIPDLEED